MWGKLLVLTFVRFLGYNPPPPAAFDLTGLGTDLGICMRQIPLGDSDPNLKIISFLSSSSFPAFPLISPSFLLACYLSDSTPLFSSHVLPSVPPSSSLPPSTVLSLPPPIQLLSVYQLSLQHLLCSRHCSRCLVGFDLCFHIALVFSHHWPSLFTFSIPCWLLFSFSLYSYPVFSPRIFLFLPSFLFAISKSMCITEHPRYYVRLKRCWHLPGFPGRCRLLP